MGPSSIKLLISGSPNITNASTLAMPLPVSLAQVVQQILTRFVAHVLVVPTQ